MSWLTKILGQDGTTQLAIEANKRAARVAIYKPGGDIYHLRITTGVLAAALAVDAPLWGIRHAAVPTKNIWLMKLDLGFSATVGFTAASQMGFYLERFSVANLAGGNAELANILKANPDSPTSELQDARRATTAALTSAGVTFEGIKMPIDSFNAPLVNTGPPLRTVFDASEVGPIKLEAGQGICLRNLVVWPAAGTGVLAGRAVIIERLIGEDDLV